MPAPSATAGSLAHASPIQFAELDALLAQSRRMLSGQSAPQGGRDPLVCDPDWDEHARLAQWGIFVDETTCLPQLLAAKNA